MRTVRAAWLSPYDDREKMGEHAIRDGGEKISSAFERGKKEKKLQRKERTISGRTTKKRKREGARFGRKKAAVFGRRSRGRCHHRISKREKGKGNENCGATTEFPIPSFIEVFQLNFREFPCLWAAAAASYCSSRAGEIPKQKKR